MAGNLHWYDFTIGFGEDIIGALNYYGFGDPLNIAAVFATQDNGYIFYAAVIFVKLYLSGTGMICFLKYHGCDGMLSAGGALVYVFSMYSLTQGMNFYVFLSVMWIFPYALTNLEKLIKDEHGAHANVKFVLLTALTACSGGFYFLYIQTIFWVLYAVWLYYNEHKDLISAKFFRKVMEIAGYYLLGIMISGIILFPALYAFFASSRTTGGDFGWRLIWDSDSMGLLFSNLTVPAIDADEFNLSLPAVCIAAIIGSLTQKEIRKELGIPTVILGLMYISPAFWRVMNGFSYPGNRWIYIIYFWAAYITVRFMQLCINGSVKRTTYICAFMLITASTVMHYFMNHDSIRCAVSAVYGILIVICGLKDTFDSKKALLLMAGGVWANVLFVYADWRICGYGMYNGFAGIDEIFGSSGIEFESIDKGQWKRVDANGAAMNDGLINGYMGTSEYLSLVNKNMSQFYQDFLISPGILGASFSLYGTDDRIAVNTVLSVEPYALPFGVIYEDAIDYQDFLNLSAVERQRVPLTRVILGEGYAQQQTDDDADVEEIIKEIQFETEYVNTLVSDGKLMTQEDGEILLKTDNEQMTGDGELYVYFKDFEAKSDFAVYAAIGDGKQIAVINPEWQYFTVENDYLVNASADNGIVSIKFGDEAVFSLDKIELFWCGNENVREQINRLEDNALKNAVFSQDKIEGDIEVQEEGWLFLSIPYNTGWKVYDNGKFEKPVKANVGFMAVKLAEGRHNIVIKYDAWWNKLGRFSTIAGVCILLLLTLKSRREVKIYV